MIKCVAQRNSEMQHHAGIAIAVGDTSGAAVAYWRSIRKIPNRGNLLAPGIAAPHVVVPVHIKAFEAAIALEGFLLATQVALHVRDRSAGVVDWKFGAQGIDGVEGSDHLWIGKTHKLRSAGPCERRGAEAGGLWIGEG